MPKQNWEQREQTALSITTETAVSPRPSILMQRGAHHYLLFFFIG
jgi:hypothetical protein